MKTHVKLFCYLLAFIKGYAKPQTGSSHSGPDIVDGQNAKPGQFPFQISMQIMNTHFCGGSILDENYILTASHCTKDFNSTDQHLITVIAGTINKNEPLQKRQVAQIIQYEDYEHENSDNNDICLLKLDRPLEFNSKIQPVILAEAHSPIPVGSPVQVSGWGSLGGEDHLKPTILQNTIIYVADQDYCVKKMKENYDRIVRSTTFCANNPKKRQGECKGDSGGPVTLNGKQVGVVSWSIKDPVCASTEFPSVFTRVPDYINWIKSHAV